MKKTDLMEAVGGIDRTLIEEHMKKKEKLARGKRARRAFVRYGVVAAVCLIIIGISILPAFMGGSIPSETVDTGHFSGGIKIPVHTLKASINTLNKVEIQEQVLYDADGVKAVINGWKNDGESGGLMLTFVNETDKKLNLSIGDIMVNGCIIPDMYATRAEAGQNAEETFMLPYDRLIENGITKVGGIKFEMIINVADDSGDTIYRGNCEVKTNFYDEMDSKEPSGVLLFEGNGVRVYGISVDTEKPAMLLCVESDKDIGIEFKNISVNGVKLTDFDRFGVFSGSKVFRNIRLSQWELNESGIEKIENIEFTVMGFESNSYAEIFVSEPISIIVSE